MGCSPSKSGAKVVWEDERGRVEGGKRKEEPAKFSRSLRMKRYELIAGVKLAMVDSVGGGLYDSDNRSCGSLNSNSRRRLDGWVSDLPGNDELPHLQSPMELPGTTCFDVTCEDELPPSPLSSANTISLPMADISTNSSSEPLSSPVRLHSRTQLHLLERSLSYSGSRNSSQGRSGCSSKVLNSPMSPTSPCKPVPSPNHLTPGYRSPQWIA